MTSSAPADAPPPLPLPREHHAGEPHPRSKGWRRWFRWFGLPVLGAGALVLPRPAMAPTIVQAQPVAPRASDGRAEDPALTTLQQLDQKADALTAGQSAFTTIVNRLAVKAGDLAIDLLVLTAAKGAWHLAQGVWDQRRGRKPGPSGLVALSPDDQGEAELASLERWIDAQDRAALAAPDMPADETLAALGWRIVNRMRDEARAAICAEKGLPRKLAGETTKEIAEQIRKALGRHEPGTALSLAIACLAAAVARVGLDRFCDPQAKALP